MLSKHDKLQSGYENEDKKEESPSFEDRQHSVSETEQEKDELGLAEQTSGQEHELKNGKSLGKEK